MNTTAAFDPIDADPIDVGTDDPVAGNAVVNAQQLAELAGSFAALGELKRLRILAELGSGEQCACDLTGCCGDRQPLLSFHLRRLREAGLVRARKEGRWMHYALDREAISALSEALARLAEGDLEPAGAEGACC